MKYSKEVKTGILAVIAIVILIFGYNFLKGKNLLDPSRTFHAVYADVEGLSQSSPVTINGMRVGQVTKIDFLNETGILVVSFNVESDFEFSRNSLAQIYGGSIIGGKSLAIVPEYEIGQTAKSGDTLPSDVEEGIMELVNERLTPLQIKVERAIVSTDSLITSFNQVLTPDTRNNIVTTFDELAETVKAFRGTAESLNAVIEGNSENIEQSVANLEETSSNFSRFSDSLALVDLGGMSRDIQKVTSDFEEISNSLKNGEGTAGKLLTDESVYNNLDRATQQMEQLLQDIKLNPRRYVNFSLFGRRPGPYHPPADTLK